MSRVSDEELDRELQLAALQSREPVDTLKVRLTQDGGLARIREQLRREKTASAAVRTTACVGGRTAELPRGPAE